MGKTLILNAGAEPLNFIPVRRAVLLVLKEKAVILEQHADKKFRSVSCDIPYPLVIRLIKYVKIPRRIRSVVTNTVLFARDHYTCQYCGRHKSELNRRERLTREHVKPVSRGGLDVWENVTTACSTCNHRKGNKLPFEAKMYPRSTPFEPRYIAVVLFGQSAHRVQRQYIEPFLKKRRDAFSILTGRT